MATRSFPARRPSRGWRTFGWIAVAIVACVTHPNLASAQENPNAPSNDYLIGPGDTLDIFVWHNPDLSTKVPVRPDGKISIPLAEDIDCLGKTPTALAREIEHRLSQYIKDPLVNVMVESFVGSTSQQIRVVGEATTPKAIPYRAHMSVLDAMIEVGGLTPYAAGNRATIIRSVGGKQESIPVKLDDLLKDGDVSANSELDPGDIIIIPQSYF